MGAWLYFKIEEGDLSRLLKRFLGEEKVKKLEEKLINNCIKQERYLDGIRGNLTEVISYSIIDSPEKVSSFLSEEVTQKLWMYLKKKFRVGVEEPILYLSPLSKDFFLRVKVGSEKEGLMTALYEPSGDYWVLSEMVFLRKFERENPDTLILRSSISKNDKDYEIKRERILSEYSRYFRIPRWIPMPRKEDLVKLRLEGLLYPIHPKPPYRKRMTTKYASLLLSP